MVSLSNQTMRPSMFWLLTEPGRAIAELGLTYSYKSFTKNKIEKKGDGHPVLIIPGFMSTKTSTKVLRDFVSNLGYNVIDWGLGRNLGKVEYTDLMLETLEELYKKHGEPISIIGWSLGGVFARQIAKERPNLVRQVITLGSPFGGITEPNNAAWMYSLITNGKTPKDIDKELLANFPLPANVPTTAIYSKEDGIVQWQTCMEIEDEIHQNIQVRGSHIGLGVNQGVFEIIKDRLQYEKTNWCYFKPKGVVKNLLFYPSL